MDEEQATQEELKLYATELKFLLSQNAPKRDDDAYPHTIKSKGVIISPFPGNLKQNGTQWVETSDGDLKANYDFDKNVISAGDFFYIETKAVEPVGKEAYGKYDNYSVYYFDIDTNVLYYFHSNI